MTVLEAAVEEGKWDAVKSKYAELIKKIPEQMERTYLVQNAQNKNVWRVVSIWKNKKGLLEYMNSLPVSEGVALFKSLGVDPQPSIFEIVGRSQK
jgi:quinol monooxygenase YgiN